MDILLSKEQLFINSVGDLDAGARQHRPQRPEFLLVGMKSAVDARVVDLPADHPGVHDPEYRRRRDEIAMLASKYRRGAPVPNVAYTDEEHALWRLVAG